MPDKPTDYPGLELISIQLILGMKNKSSAEKMLAIYDCVKDSVLYRELDEIRESVMKKG